MRIVFERSKLAPPPALPRQLTPAVLRGMQNAGLFHTIVMPTLARLPGSIKASLHWRLGVVASVVRRMNEVTVHWARFSTGMGDRLWVGIPSRCVTSQLG